MVIELSTKKPTLLVAETEEVGALHQVLRSQTSRCVVLELVVHGALIAHVVLVVFVVFVVLIVLVVLDFVVCVVHGALIALDVLVVVVVQAIWPLSWIRCSCRFC